MVISTSPVSNLPVILHSQTPSTQNHHLLENIGCLVFFWGLCLSQNNILGGFPVGVVGSGKKFVTNLSHMTPKTGN